jgi:phosphocarrier protein
MSDKIGFHARTAAVFAQEAAAFKSDIRVTNARRADVNGKSMLHLMAMCVRTGDDIVVSAEGEDAEEALDRLRRLVERNFELEP